MLETAGRSTQNMHTHQGAWQRRRYDPSRLLRVGCWLNCASDTAGLLSGYHAYINPALAEMQRAQLQTKLSALLDYLGGGGVSAGAKPPYDWNPFDATRPEHLTSHQWWPHFNNWQIKFKDWGEIRDLLLPWLIDWLAPGWLKNPAPLTDDPSPCLDFWTPHGKVGEDRAVGQDFFNALTAREFGLDHLVDGFYELCRYLHALGVTCSIHNGAPTQNDSHLCRPQWHYDETMEWLTEARLKVTLDAAVLTPLDGLTGECARTLQEMGDGVGIEGIPQATDPLEMQWAETPYDFNVLGTHMLDRVHPELQKPFAKGHWPVLGSQEFGDAYGQDRWIFWALLENDFGLTYPHPVAKDVEKDAYLAAYAVECKKVVRWHPKSVLLLPVQLCFMAMSRRKLASEFYE